MAAPELTFSIDRSKLSRQPGFDSVSVSFTADQYCAAFECRATKEGEDYGVGKGELIASFSAIQAGVPQKFSVSSSFLTRGDGVYRISLFAKGQNGSWNDNHKFITSNGLDLISSDGKTFLCVR